MANSSVPQPRLAASIRLVLAMFRLYADIETSFGKAILDILKKQYPDQKIDIQPASVGHKLMAIARKQNQNDDSRAMDAIQDFLTYISTGSKFETTEEGEKVDRKNAKPWDFTKDFPTWQAALDAIYSNVRRRSMDKSMDNSKRKKLEKSVDDAFGKRGEDGGAPGGGEGHMPDTDSPLGRALDDRAATKEFLDLLSDYIPELRKTLPPEQAALFDLVYEDEVGSFGADIKDNMNQASAFKEKHPELYQKNEKRWSGFVGDTRKKLLKSIQDFMEKHLTPGDYDVLYDTFHGDTTPKNVEKIELEKDDAKLKTEVDEDSRSIAKLKWQEENGSIDDKGKKRLDSYKKKYETEHEGKDAKGKPIPNPYYKKLDFSGIKPEQEPKKPKAEKPKAEKSDKPKADKPKTKPKTESEGQSQTASIAHRLASRTWQR